MKTKNIKLEKKGTLKKSHIDLILKKVGVAIALFGTALFFVAAGLGIWAKAESDAILKTAAITTLATSIANYSAGLGTALMAQRRFESDKLDEILGPSPTPKQEKE